MSGRVTGLFFGTFNPIHIGHLAIANYMVEYGSLDEVWMVVTPHNPLKKKHTLLDDYQRLHMVNLALEGYEHKAKPSNVEFSLPQPSYTVKTLAHLSEKHPDRKFALIMGEDNLRTLHKWKNHEVLLEEYRIIVYPRRTEKSEPHRFLNHHNVTLVAAPIIEISSTLVRNAVAEGRDLRYFLHPSVYRYMDEMNFYK